MNTPAEQTLTGGAAIKAMLERVDPSVELPKLKSEVLATKSPSKRDALVKRIKYLDALQRMNLRPEQAYVLHTMPILPPIARPVTQTGGNRMEYADVTELLKDHMLVNNALKEVVNVLPDNQLSNERKDLYEGAKAIMGVGEAITGNSRGANLKGIIKQVGGDGGPKLGFFQNKLLSKKQDFSGRATIYAEPDLGFNEAAVPRDMLWELFKYHVIRELVRSGHNYVSAKQAVEARSPAAVNIFNRVIEKVPVILNRAPTLMRTNITAHYAKPIEGKTIGLNPIHLPMYAGDYDGDAVQVIVPMTPEAVEEAKAKLLPEAHIHDLRKGHEASMVAPGHEAILGSMYITEPDLSQKPRHFKTEAEVLEALRRGEVKENTPISVG